MGTSAAELERLVVRLVGDHSDYDKMLEGAVADTVRATNSVVKAASAAEAAQRRTMQEGARVTQTLMTQQERHVQTVRKLDELFIANAINFETYTRGLQEARSTLPSVVAATEAAAAAQAELAAATARGAQVTQAMLTAEEVHIQRVQELDGLLQRGVITQETFNRAERASLEQLPAMVEAQRAYNQQLREQAQVQAQQVARAQAAHNQRMAEGRAVTESVMTAEERYTATQGRLNRMVAQGTITQETYDRAIHQALTTMPAYITYMNLHNAAQERARGIVQGMMTPMEQYRQRLAEINRLHRDGYLSATEHARAIHHLGNEMEVTFGARAIVWGRNMAQFGRSMSMYVTAPLALIGGLAVREFAKFDDAMTKSTAIMGGVSADMRKKMEDVAKGISANSSTKPEDLAKGYYYLASAGMTAAQAMGALPVVEKFSIAGAFDMARATEMLSDSQTALGLRVADTTQNMQNMKRVSDVLVQAANVSNGSVEQFASALSNHAAAAMRMVNMEVEEGTAVLAAFADQGVKGQSAGEAFSIVLRDLQVSSMKATDQWKAMGLAVYDAHGKMRPIADIIQDIEHVLGPMSDMQKRATLTMLGFQDRSVQYIQSLVGMSGKIRNYEQTLRSAGGTTAQVAAVQLQSFEQRMEKVGNKLRIAGMAIAEALLPMIEKMVGWVQKAVDWFMKLDPATQEWIVKIGVIAAVVGPALVVLGTMLTTIGQLATAYNFLAGNMGTIISLFTGAWQAAGSAGINILIRLMQVLGTTTIAGTLLKGAMVGLAIYGISVLVQWVYNANSAIKDFNKSLKESDELAKKLMGIDAGKHNRAMQAANNETDTDKHMGMLTAEKDRLDKDAAGMTDTVKTVQKQIDKFKAEHSTVGDTMLFGQRDAKILEGLENDLKQAQGRAEAVRGMVDETKAAIEQAQQSAKGANAANAAANGTVAGVPGMEGDEDGEAPGKKELKALQKTIEESTPPIDKYNARMKQLNEWFKANKLTPEQFGRAVKEAQEDLKKANEKDGKESKAAKMAEDAQNQIDTFRQLSIVQRANALTLKDGTAAEIAHARAVAANLQAMEDKRKAEEKIKEIEKKHRTPQQEFEDGKKELDMLLKHGMAIADYNTELEELQKKLRKDTKMNFSVSGIEAMEGGSAAAKAHGAAQRALLQQRPDFFKKGFDINGNPAEMTKVKGKSPAEMQHEKGQTKKDETDKKKLTVLDKIAKNTDPANRKGRGGRKGRTANLR